YEFDMSVETTPGITIADAHGFPASEDGTEAGFEVSTIFLSKRKGALLLRVTPVNDDDSDGTSGEPGDGEAEPSGLDPFEMSARMQYLTPGGTLVSDTLEAAYDGAPVDERGHYYEQPGTARTVALAVLVSGMHEAATLYAEEPEAAIALMSAVRDRFAADAESIAHESLDPELQLAQDLLALMEEGAPQGDLYPYPY